MIPYATELVLAAVLISKGALWLSKEAGNTRSRVSPGLGPKLTVA